MDPPTVERIFSLTTLILTCLTTMSLHSSSEKAPSYNELNKERYKENNHICDAHSRASIPFIHAQLQQQQAKEAIRAISIAFGNLADGSGCSECILREIAQTVTLCLRELKTAKKNGKWSKEEKKTMKREVKVAFKDIKREVKQTWKNGD
ncbi:unnamed protein product [Periconia digitata]|uniref:Uncharacterized protein n=1 Tax=Periconia digitata TaxID=1303443 RepID=A0A9W4UVC6_9PLEO|nr:unnamed protein product [Periconia digitata]